MVEPSALSDNLSLRHNSPLSHRAEIKHSRRPWALRECFCGFYSNYIDLKIFYLFLANMLARHSLSSGESGSGSAE